MARIRSFEEIVQNVLEDFRLTQPDLDTKPGTVTRDLIDTFMARLSEVYQSISETSRLQSIFTVAGNDLDNLAANYNITRQTATTSFGTALLTTNSLDNDISIPIGSVITAVNGVNFNVTSNYSMKLENKNAYAATALRYSSDLSAVGITDQYAIEVPAESVSTGASTNISKYSLRRSDISGIDNVTNVSSFSGGSGSESDDSLRQRVILSLSGNNVGTKDGIESIMKSNTNVVDVYVAVPGDPLLERDGTVAGVDSSGNAIVITEGTGGKVDVYIYGTVGENSTDSFIYRDVTGGGPTDSGNDRIIGTGGSTSFATSLNRRRLTAFENGTVPTQPVSSIISVSGSESGGNFAESFVDADGNTAGNFELLKDTSIGQGGSPFGADKIHFISNEIDLTDEITGKGTYNGQDPLVFADVNEISEVTEDVFVLNESSVVESSRNIIRTLHKPITTVSRVYNATTGERYVIEDQNVDGTGSINLTGRIQISGQTLPSATDVLQVNYTWQRPYDENIDFDSFTSLLSTDVYNNLVQDSVDWGFSNIVLEDTLPIVVGISGARTVTVTYNVSRVTSIKSGSTEIYNIVDNTGAGFSNNIITLPTATTATGNVDVEYIANIKTLIPETSLADLPITRSGNGYVDISGYQPITTSDNILSSDVTYYGTGLPEDDLNPWSFLAISGITSPTITNVTASGREVLQFAGASTGGFYIRTESILDSSSDLEYSVSMRIPVTTLGSSWNSDVGFYFDDGTYEMRFVFFTDASGNRKIGLRNSLSSPIYSATASVNFTNFHTYRIEKNGTTDVRLYIDGALSITALYNVANFLTTNNSNTIGFGYFDDTTPATTQWESAIYSLSSASSIQKPLRYAPSQLKCSVNNIPGPGVLTIKGTTFNKVDTTVVSSETFNNTVDLSNWTGLTSTQLADINYKLAKVEKIQKIGSTGSVLVNYDIIGDVPDIERRYTFSTLPNEDLNYPWSVEFDDASEVDASVSVGILTFETSGQTTTGPSVYFRTEDHFKIGTIMSATFRMKIDSFTLQQVGTSTIYDTGVYVWIKNTDVTIPLTFVTIGSTAKYMAIIKNTSLVSDPSDAYVLYPVDWDDYHTYEFEVDNGGNITVSVDDASPSISIPYIESQFDDGSSISSFGIESEAIIFGNKDNRPTTSLWDSFIYDSKDAANTKYKLKDNLLDLHLADIDTTLDSFEVLLPETSTNDSAISVGNTVRAIMYYAKNNDTESLKFTSDGTLYTSKNFAFIESIYIASGFRNQAGNVSGTIQIDTANQPDSNSTYNADYSYTAPKQGERISIQYTYNKLIGDLSLSLEDFRVVTSDILVKSAEEIDIDVAVDVVPETGFNLGLVNLQQNVQNSIIAFLTVEKLGTTIDSSDIIDVTYNTAGVDRVTLITFNESGQLGIRSYITADGKQYLAPGTITVNIKDRAGNSLL